MPSLGDRLDPRGDIGVPAHVGDAFRDRIAALVDGTCVDADTELEMGRALRQPEPIVPGRGTNQCLKCERRAGSLIGRGKYGEDGIAPSIPGERDAPPLARVPGVPGHADLLRGGLRIEWRQRGRGLSLMLMGKWMPHQAPERNLRAHHSLTPCSRLPKTADNVSRYNRWVSFIVVLLEWGLMACGSN